MIRSTSSAGGILARRAGSFIEIVIVERMHDIEPKWQPILRQLPKGAMESKESFEETALREVREETGYDAKILEKVGTAKWEYQRNSIHWEEIVHYYLMSLKTELQHEHDDEYDNVRWIKIELAATILSYPEERELLKKVIENVNYISQF
ncbi:NUDIX domain-containing protein [Candidatus Dojkabacteria bacterium]|nr:NUDIX domain-containing protein [Candidatus Dojkabacteria bacterium]